MNKKETSVELTARNVSLWSRKSCLKSPEPVQSDARYGGCSVRPEGDTVVARLGNRMDAAACSHCVSSECITMEKLQARYPNREREKTCSVRTSFVSSGEHEHVSKSLNRDRWF